MKHKHVLLAVLVGDAACTTAPTVWAAQNLYGLIMAWRDLLFNNERDEIAPPSLGAAYLAAIARREAKVEMVTTADESHVELIAPESVSWTRQRDAILRSLAISPGLVKPE